MLYITESGYNKDIGANKGGFKMTKQVAITILEQLGGNKFIAMTGAKNFSHSENTLSFRIPRQRKISAVRITLEDDDTYTMEFISIHGIKMTTINTEKNVYFDELQNIFTANTGLYTKLF